jgi:hypothetical protein
MERLGGHRDDGDVFSGLFHAADCGAEAGATELPGGGSVQLAEFFE